MTAITIVKFTHLLALALAISLFSGCGSSTQSESSENRAEASLAEVNDVLATWYTFKAAYPTNLVELESAPFFKKKLPTPPPGQKLVFDPNTRRAVFARDW